uniref:Uncharacterized protein n=1 Tax=Acrobeloides nanus TaxID=290746 RepID=A0A914CAB2_9BILA
MDSKRRGSAGPLGRLWEFSSTSIHVWTAKSLTSLNNVFHPGTSERRSQRRHKNEKKHHDDDGDSSSMGAPLHKKHAISCDACNHAATSTTFFVDESIPPRTTYRREEIRYEVEERYWVKSPETRSVNEVSIHAIKPTVSSATSYQHIPRIQMGQRGIRAQHASKSETRLIEIKRPPRAEPAASTSLARDRSPYTSRPRIPGEVIRTYEERYESSEELEEWMRSQPLEVRRLNKHDRLIMKIAG